MKGNINDEYLRTTTTNFYKNITDIYHAQYQHESNSKDIHRQLLLNYALYF